MSDPHPEHLTVGDIRKLLDGEGALVSCGGEEHLLSAPVSGCSFDSREPQVDNLFFCKGVHFHAGFLDAAVDAGATCFVADAALAGSLSLERYREKAYALVVNDIRSVMASLPPVIYRHPERDVEVVGITGTKGKSTTAYMLRSILVAAGRTPGILGSIMTDDGVEHFESHNTTPEAPELWRHVANCRKTGRHELVMEVSSQGLKYGRVAGLHLDIACFLNIGRDHISAIEHPDFKDYFSSKLKIFEQCDTAVVNLGSDHADRVLSAASAGASRVVRVASEGVSKAGEADARAVEVHAEDGVVDFVLEVCSELSPSGEPMSVPVALGIPGVFNVENALVAIACALLMGVGADAIKRGLAHLRVPGRMEVVRSTSGKVVAIVDYAHNKLSFETLFKSVRAEYPSRRIVAVFGAPGDKAKERREQLPKAAAPYSDLLIFTEEDPAHERVADICAELASHVPKGTLYEIILDREKAIERAFEVARGWDEPSVLLLLAKGDETRQHRGDEYPTIKSDLAMAKELVATV